MDFSGSVCSGIGINVSADVLDCGGELVLVIWLAREGGFGFKPLSGTAGGRGKRLRQTDRGESGLVG